MAAGAILKTTATLTVIITLILLGTGEMFIFSNVTKFAYNHESSSWFSNKIRFQGCSTCSVDRDIGSTSHGSSPPLPRTCGLVSESDSPFHCLFSELDGKNLQSFRSSQIHFQGNLHDRIVDPWRRSQGSTNQNQESCVNYLLRSRRYLWNHHGLCVRRKALCELVPILFYKFLPFIGVPP